MPKQGIYTGCVTDIQVAIQQEFLHLSRLFYVIQTGSVDDVL